MKCPKCGLKMKTDDTVDEKWRFYRCVCGYTAAKHIHVKYFMLAVMEQKKR